MRRFLPEPTWALICLAACMAAHVASADTSFKASPIFFTPEKLPDCSGKARGGFIDPKNGSCYISCYGPYYQDPLGKSSNGHRSCCGGGLCHVAPKSNAPVGVCAPCDRVTRSPTGPNGAPLGQPAPSQAPSPSSQTEGPILLPPIAIPVRLPNQDIGKVNSPACNDKSAVPCQVTVQSWYYKAGVSGNFGGAVNYVGSTFGNQNFLNVHDTGRLLQQSYYGDADGSVYGSQAWMWNPVQGGDVFGNTGEVLNITKLGGSQVATTSLPRNWAGGQLLRDVVMYTKVTANTDHVAVNMRMQYNGKKDQSSHPQELPAVFVARRFDKLWFYDGKKPWTGAPASWIYPHTFYDMKDAAQTQVIPTEGWVAYQSSATGEAVGFLSPSLVVAVAYRVGFENVGGPTDFNTSYVAPIAWFGIPPGANVSYNVYVASGSIGSIRSTFKSIVQSFQKKG